MRAARPYFQVAMTQTGVAFPEPEPVWLLSGTPGAEDPESGNSAQIPTRTQELQVHTAQERL